MLQKNQNELFGQHNRNEKISPLDDLGELDGNYLVALDRNRTQVGVDSKEKLMDDIVEIPRKGLQQQYD